MQDVTAALGQITSKLTKRGKQMYLFPLNGQDYVSFKPELYQKGANLQGQEVDARVNVEQNGSYTNYYLEDIAPKGQLVPMAMPAVPGTPAQAVPNGALPAPPQAQPEYQRDYSPETAARVSRSSAVTTAFEFVGSIYTGTGEEGLKEAVKYAERLAEEIVNWIGTGSFDGQQASAPSPQEVVAQVNAVAGEGAVQAGPPWHS